jgi:hypothetical protein
MTKPKTEKVNPIRLCKGEIPIFCSFVIWIVTSSNFFFLVISSESLKDVATAALMGPKLERRGITSPKAIAYKNIYPIETYHNDSSSVNIGLDSEFHLRVDPYLDPTQ